ncbi:hypothetical protein F5Y10DRAFT_212036 [Nemania abortiva]|nr:hypothetical protein F5Y10DRAFT_212036 [Nemania abortiva]
MFRGAGPSVCPSRLLLLLLNRPPHDNGWSSLISPPFFFLWVVCLFACLLACLLCLLVHDACSMWQVACLMQNRCAAAAAACVARRFESTRATTIRTSRLSDKVSPARGQSGGLDARRTSQKSRGLTSTEPCRAMSWPGLLPSRPLPAQEMHGGLGLGRGTVGCAFWRAHRGLHSFDGLDRGSLFHGWWMGGLGG